MPLLLSVFLAAPLALGGCRLLLAMGDEKVLDEESANGVDDSSSPNAAGDAAREDDARPLALARPSRDKHPDAGDAGDAGIIKAAAWTVSTFVGSTTSAAGTTDGVGTNALLQSPWGLAVSGNHLYVQSWPGITRDVNLTTAATSTIANEGAASGSVVLGNALFITDWWNNCVTRLDLTTHDFSVFAGSGMHQGTNVSGWVDDVGTAARFMSPYGITTDGTSLYVTDVSATIRKLDPVTARVTTLAGVAYSIGGAEGSFATARFYYPVAITYTNGKLYVTDTGNHNVRTLDLTAGVVSTLAGSGATGSDDGVGKAATFHWPYGITPDAHGNLYVTDQAADVVRRIVIATGVVTTIAGEAYAFDHVDAVGSAARFNGPQGIAIDAAENLYVSEYGNHVVRKITLP